MSQLEQRYKALEIIAHRQARLTEEGTAIERLEDVLDVARRIAVQEPQAESPRELVTALEAIVERGNEAEAAACLQSLGWGILLDTVRQ
ncbi:MAG: hypothetical protein ACP5HG_04355 [Anaerolineae bacterium]